MPDQWTPEWSNHVFSTPERDQRWKKVRDLMARDGIDVIVCLQCTNSHNRGQADPVYLTQLGENEDEAIVAFPLEGEVTAWHSRGGVWPSSNWLSDVRQAPRGTGGTTIVDWLKERGIKSGTVGVAGMTGGFLAHCREIEGEANWQSVEILKQGFPGGKIVSATDLLGEARYQKSEEELDFLRKGAQVSEKVIDAIKAHARAGVAEREVFGWMMYTTAVVGGSFAPMVGWSSGPLGDTYHRLELPSLRKFQTGDVLSVEIEGRWGGYIAQLDQTFSIGPAHQDLKDGMDLAWESFDKVMDVLKPGVTVGEVLDAGTITGMGGRGEARPIMHGRGTGDDGPLVTTRITPELRAIELKENTSFILKPSATVDGKADYGRWGESIVLRQNVSERLGTRPRELPELI